MSYFGLRYLGVFFIILSFLSFINIIYSYYFKFYLNLNNYIISLFVSLFIGTILFLIEKNTFNIKIDIYGKIVTVILGYITIPIVISIPYFLSIYNISFLDSYFEAISGFTSTGFTTFDNLKKYDESIILWRASSQWVGGLYFLFCIILLIDIFDNNLKKSLTNYLSFNTSEIIKQSIKIFLLYTILTLILFLFYEIFNFRSFVSLNLALSVISSGGFLPVDSLSSILDTNIKEIALSLSMLISFFSIFLTYNLVFLKGRNLNFFQEDVYLFFYLLFLTLALFFFFNYKNSFSSIFLSLVSSITNIGFSMKNIPSNLSIFFLILVIIGGSFFSTSSGIRFLKIYALFKFSINNLISHAKPKNIFLDKSIIFDISYKKDEIYKYFLSILIFLISLFILTSLLSLSGLSINSALKLSILTLMNTVNSSTYGLENLNFSSMTTITKYCLMLFMVIGRVELITVLIILKKFLFKN